MAKFPEPPPAAQLAVIPPAHHVLPAGTRCWRIYFRGGPYPTAWNALRGYGPTTARFDHHLLDLTGSWPTRAGASMAINSGPRPRARRWSQAIYAAYPAVEGLYYASSLDANRPAVMLYERAASALPRRPAFHRALADPTLTAAIVRAARRFNYIAI